MTIISKAHYRGNKTFAVETAEAVENIEDICAVAGVDLLVLATGYHTQQELVRRVLGEEVAERVGPVWGFGEGGESRQL